MGLPQPTLNRAVAETKAASPDAQLDPKSSAVVAAVDRFMDDYPDDFWRVRKTMTEAISGLQPDQITAVLQAQGQKWLLRMLNTDAPSGAYDFIALVSDLSRSGKVTDDGAVFGGVVPALCGVQGRDQKLKDFVWVIAINSNGFSEKQKDQIIWGTHEANPTLSKTGHWAQMPPCAQAALLAGLVEAAAKVNAPSATRLLPGDLERHYQELMNKLSDGSPADQAIAASMLPKVRLYLDGLAAPKTSNPASGACALM
jgi:hypothetical protein